MTMCHTKLAAPNRGLFWINLGRGIYHAAVVAMLLVFMTSYSSADNSHSSHSGHSHEGHHELLEVIAENIPSVTLKVEKDKVSGWNIFLETKNFSFTPESVNGPAVQNQGHAHIYINGKKAGRLYSPYFHLDSLHPGENEISVTLNADDHSPFALNGKLIEARVTVTSHSH